MTPSLLRSRNLWLALVLAFVGELAILASMDLGSLVEMIPDDSFFYLIIARNFPHAGDFSFDGKGATSGFQPLWQLCLLPFGAWVHSSKGLLLLVLGICSLLHVGSAAGIYRLLEFLSGRLAGACGAAFWLLNPSILRWFWGIKENGLYAVLLLLVLVQTLKWIRGAGDQGGPCPWRLAWTDRPGAGELRVARGDRGAADRLGACSRSGWQAARP